MVEVSLTVGKLDASLALLLTKDHHVIEFPTILLPDGVAAGSVVTIKSERDFEQEKEEEEKFTSVQEEILKLYGTNGPQAPVLKIKNVTQTSAVLEWDSLELGSASLKSLTLYKNGSRLGQIPNPLVNKTTKLSGLPVDTPYEFYLSLATTSGIYKSEVVSFRTHKMTDLTGIAVCLGEINTNEGITREEIEESLNKIGAKPLQDEVKVDTTHFITTSGVGAQWKKALDNNIPIVRPEWLKACELERRIVGVRNFYLDADPKFLENNKFSKKEEPKAVPKTEEVAPTPPNSSEPAKEERPQDSNDLEDVPLNDTPEPVNTEEAKAEKSEETKSEETKSEEPKSEEPKSEEPKSEEPKAEETLAVESEETKEPEEAKAEPSETEPVDSEETKVEESKTVEEVNEPETIEEIAQPEEQPIAESLEATEEPEATESSEVTKDDNTVKNDESAEETEPISINLTNNEVSEPASGSTIEPLNTSETVETENTSVASPVNDISEALDEVDINADGDEEEEQQEETLPSATKTTTKNKKKKSKSKSKKK